LTDPRRRLGGNPHDRLPARFPRRHRQGMRGAGAQPRAAIDHVVTGILAVRVARGGAQERLAHCVAGQRHSTLGQSMDDGPDIRHHRGLLAMPFRHRSTIAHTIFVAGTTTKFALLV
jgi:hypothetical protein